MVGGRDFKETQFNRATQALRQPGSSFKPFVYLAAIQRGWTAATIVKDNPMIFFLDPQTRKWSLMADDMDSLEEFAQTHPESNLSDTNKVWAPSNYGGKFRGDITLRTALALSINMSVVETIAKIGPAAVVSAARSLGITTPLLETYTLALGAGEVTLQEMVGAYAVFASGGIKNEPFIITKITKESTDKNVQSEQIIEEHIPTPTRVISPQVAFVMTNMLRSVVERGTGYRARQLGRPVAAKTGTSNDETDAWFIGYTADYVAGVWVGYDEQKIVLGAGATGGTLAAPIWVDFMKVAENNLPVKNFVQPDGIEWQYIDPRTGFIAPAQSPGAYREAFIRGTAPRQFSTRGSSYISDDLLEESGGF
jgi:penicillin-binding protein 1A